MGEPFIAAGYWYDTFEQTTDEEVVAALLRHAPREWEMVGR